ncbi:MAG: DNA helicase RecG, partial [Ignavibacteria bacterium]|nr:DNA helicase RecG [Ignavibacteria bacterium]
MTNSFQSVNSLRYLKGVGEAREKILKSLGISTIEDLLFYFPKRYYDRSSVVPIIKARLILEKNIKDEFTFIGEIVSVRKVYTKRRTILEIIIEDDTAQLKAIYFQGIQIFEKIFSGKKIAALSGNVSASPSGNPVLIHPTFDFIQDLENPKFYNTGVIVPYYSLRGINQLKQKNFGSYTLREIIRNALNSHLKFVKETLPEYIIKDYKLADIHTALKNLHFPKSMTELSIAKRRLKFEEMFYFQLLGAISRTKFKAENPEIKFTKVGENTKTFLEKILPFDLTSDQKKVLKEIFADFKSGSPMNRLLQG